MWGLQNALFHLTSSHPSEVYLVVKVNSGWSSDLFKVTHRRVHTEAESESDRRLPALPHTGPSQGLSLSGLRRVGFLWEAGAQDCWALGP